MKYKASEEEARFLSNYDIRKFDQPSVTVDIAVFAVQEEKEDTETGKASRKDPALSLSILMIRRGSYPYKDCWALPGGFVRPDESLEKCAQRELAEETSVTNAYLRPFGFFSETDRDPRGWIISNGFLALVDHKDYQLHAGTDAWDARWFQVKICPKDIQRNIAGAKAEISAVYDILLVNNEDDICLSASVEEIRSFSSHHETKEYRIKQDDGFAFDHARIILQAFMQLRKEAENDGMIVFDLMPEKFTLNALQDVYEIILGKPLLTPNFRRKILPMLVETDEKVLGVGHRPAKLYKRNLEAFYKG